MLNVTKVKEVFTRKRERSIDIDIYIDRYGYIEIFNKYRYTVIDIV